MASASLRLSSARRECPGPPLSSTAEINAMGVFGMARTGSSPASTQVLWLVGGAGGATIPNVILTLIIFAAFRPGFVRPALATPAAAAADADQDEHMHLQDDDPPAVGNAAHTVFPDPSTLDEPIGAWPGWSYLGRSRVTQYLTATCVCMAVAVIPSFLCTCTADQATIDTLEARRPGNDGGCRQTRSERRTWPRAAHAALSGSDQLKILESCIEVLVTKATFGTMPEAAVDFVLASINGAFQRAARMDLAEAMPQTYKGMLTFLLDMGGSRPFDRGKGASLASPSARHDTKLRAPLLVGAASWDEEILYDICLCGQLYRCESRNALSCPDCGLERWEECRGRGSKG